ncbi:MAG: 2-phosphosulfolactate phosphatase [Bacillota bacterium]
MSQPRLHVLLRKEELDPNRIGRAVAVVIDVLFATSTIAAVLAHGATAVIPVLDQEEGLRVARDHPEALLAGEKDSDLIPGFGPPTPLALLEVGVRGKEIIYSTTNGTVASRLAEGARAVYAASLLNTTAVVDHLLEHHRDETVVLICAGSGGRFNLEDFVGAGLLAGRLLELGPWRPTDAALAAMGLFANRRYRPEDWLFSSAIGRMVSRRGFEAEVRYAAVGGPFQVVPVLRQGRFVPTGSAH